MDDLPELPFEQVLSYLNLEDRLKARAVSRSWRKKFDCYPVKTLCYSDRPLGFIHGKNRWVSGTFAQNFISCTRFPTFFDTFGQTILSTLKRLRLCALDLDEQNETFAPTLNSFDQLEELSIIRFNLSVMLSETQFELNLPMLTSLQLEDVREIEQLTLNAPRLKQIRLVNCNRLSLVVVHGESVERLLADCFEYTALKNLKNLQYLYLEYYPATDSTLLSSLDQLKEIHTIGRDRGQVANLLRQKQRYGRADLKIYLYGLLLNGPDDPAIRFLPPYTQELFVQLAENSSRLPDEIPFYQNLNYSAIEDVAPGLQADILKRFTGLYEVTVYSPVKDIQRFLALLKNLKSIVKLTFLCDQPQDLFDRLPEPLAVQWLIIYDAPADLEFLRRMKQLNDLDVRCSIDVELVRKFFEELPFLLVLSFQHNNKLAIIEDFKDSGWTQSGPFQVWCGEKSAEVPDLEAAIQFIVRSEPQENAQQQ